MSLSRRQFMKSAAGAAALSFLPNAPRAQAEKKSPNVLFIAIDDLNDWIGCMGGHPDAATPKIDRLASMGVLFTNAHCAGPVCNPSRTALLTGLRPSTTGIYDNGNNADQVVNDNVTLPEYFKNQGYHAYGYGKIFHGQYRPAWSEWGRGAEYNETPCRKTNKDSVGPIRWGAMDADDDAMTDYQTVRWAADELLKEHDKPFFLACGIHKPHLPWEAPKKYFDMFPLDKIHLPERKDGDMDDIPEAGRRIGDRSTHQAMLKAGEEKWRRAVQAYLACTAFVDTCIGVLLDGLENSPHRSNTIVILWSDHGWHLGEKLHWRKMTLWEEATRNILCMIVPGMTKTNQRCDASVSLLDIYPTLVELCGLPPKEKIEGDSFVSLLKDVRADWERPAVTTYGYGNHSVRSRHWRYTRYNNGGEELYDHRKDPQEWNNLDGDPKYASLKEDLAKWLPKINVQEGRG